MGRRGRRGWKRERGREVRWGEGGTGGVIGVRLVVLQLRRPVSDNFWVQKVPPHHTLSCKYHTVAALTAVTNTGSTINSPHEGHTFHVAAVDMTSIPGRWKPLDVAIPTDSIRKRLVTFGGWRSRTKQRAKRQWLLH